MRILLTDLLAEYLELTSALKSKQPSKNTDKGNSSNTKDGDGMKEKSITYIIIFIQIITYNY